MVLLKVLFWLFVAIDAVVLGLMLLLGLAAATPSRTSPLSVLAFMLVPALVLGAAVAVFLFAQWKGARVLAFLLVASPVLIAVAGRGWAEWSMRGFQNENGELTWFRSGAARQLESAIAKSDAAAVNGTGVNAEGRAGMTPLLLAIRQLEKTPEDLSVLRALLEKGADPNAGSQQLPLVAAIAASRRCGIEPVRLLLEAGANPNATSEFGDPAWFVAAGAGVDPEVMRLMLKHGANVKARNAQGGNAVVTGVLTRNWKAVLMLLENGAEWKGIKMPMGLPVREAMEADARAVGEGNGLREVLEFLRKQDSH